MPDVGGAFVKIQPDLDEFRTELDAELREAMSGASGSAKVGADTSEAKAKLDSINAELAAWGQRMGAASADVDTARAQAKLDEISTKLDEFGHKRATATADVNTDSGLSGVSSLLGAILALSPAVVAFGATAAASLAILPALMGGAATGAGALVLGLHGVLPALQAMDQADASSAQTSNAAATTRLANAQSEVSAARAVQSAEESLANARTQAAQSAITSAETVQRAEQSLANAQQSQDNQAITGAEQVAAARKTLADALAQQSYDQQQADQSLASAEQALANARVAAANQVSSAEMSLHSAEESYTQALYSEQQAQQAVITARQTAQQQLESYNQQLADGALQQRQATLAVQSAQDNLNATLANPAATQLQREQAQLSYDQAVQQQKDQAANYQQLQQTAADAAKAGVDGATAVTNAEHQAEQAQQATADAAARQAQAQQALGQAQVAAAQSVADAEQRVADVQAANQRQAQADADRVSASQQSLADTMRTTSQAQVAAAQSVAAAVQSLADAQRNQADQAAAGAQHVADAQRSLTDAQSNQESTNERIALSAQKAAGGNAALAKAMADLSPAGQSFVEWVHSNLIPVFDDASAKVQGTFLPALQGVVTDLLPVFSNLVPFIVDAGQGITGFLGQLADYLNSGPGLSNMNTILNSGSTLMGDLGAASVTFFEAVGNLGAAAAPIVSSIGDAILHGANAFAQWTTDGGMTHFLAYVEQVGPAVMKDLGDLVGLFGHWAQAVAPLAPPLLAIIGAIIPFFTSLIQSNAGLIGFGTVFVGGLIEVSKIAGPLGGVFKDLGNLSGLAGGTEKAASGLGKIVSAGGSLVRLVAPMAAGLGEVAAGLWASAAAATGLDAVPLVALIVGIALAIAALVYGLYELVTHWSTVWDAIKSVAVTVWDFIRDHWQIFAALFGPLGVMAVAIDWLVTHWGEVWSTIQAVASTVWGAIQTAAGVVWGAIQTAITTPVDAVQTVISTVWGAIQTFLGTTWGAISSSASTIFGAIGTAIGAVWTGIDTAVRAVWNALKTFLSAEWTGFQTTVTTLWTGIVTAITSVWDGLSTAASGVWDTVQGVFQTGVNAIIDVLDFFIGGINKVLGLIPGVNLSIPLIPHWTASPSRTPVAGPPAVSTTAKPYATGGTVPGSGSGDTVPAMLTPGEYVVRRSAVDAVGVPFLDGLNAQHFDLGGIVSAVGGALGSVGSTVSGVLRGAAGDAASIALDALMAPVRAMLVGVPVPLLQSAGDGLLNSLHDDIVAFIKGQSSDSTASGGGGRPPSDPTGNVAIAQHLAVPYHWDSGGEWNALWNVGNRESGWDTTALNPSSGAYGIPQALPGDKMAAAGPDWRTNPATQIAWMLGYIKDRYGDPAGAWAHEMSAGWYGMGGRVAERYDSGGWLPPGGIAVNTSARPEPVLTSEQSDAFLALARSAARPAPQSGTKLVLRIGQRDFDAYLSDEVGSALVDAVAGV